MRRTIAVLGLMLYVVAWAPKGEQVPLVTLENQTCCWLSFGVVDVVADPVLGTPINKADGQPFRWQAGYTAWRAGTEVEVRDAIGNVVLRTPGRYWISPTFPDWAVGKVRACPSCELGGGPL